MHWALNDGMKLTEAHLRVGGGEDLEEHEQKHETRKDFYVKHQVHVGNGNGKVGWGQTKESLKSPSKFYFIL